MNDIEWRKNYMMKKVNNFTIDDVIKAIKEFNKDKCEVRTRYLSWDYCYKLCRDCFKEKEKPKQPLVEYLSLNLSWYLASWGMLRASFLLNYDYKVHIPMIEELLSQKNKEKFKQLYTPPEDKTKLKDYLDLVREAVKIVKKNLIEIKRDYYDKIFKKPIKEQKDDELNITATLQTKVLLGIFGCTPAYDSFFSTMSRQNTWDGQSWNGVFNRKSLEEKWIFYFKHKEKFDSLKFGVDGDTGYFYPPMKLIDMALFQIGLENSEEEKEKKKQKNHD
jgi:hypothetical protein